MHIQIASSVICMSGLVGISFNFIVLDRIGIFTEYFPNAKYKKTCFSELYILRTLSTLKINRKNPKAKKCRLNLELVIGLRQETRLGECSDIAIACGPQDFRLLVDALNTLNAMMRSFGEEFGDPDSVLASAGGDRHKLVWEILQQLNEALDLL